MISLQKSLLAGVGVLALAVAGCGSSSNSKSDSTTTGKTKTEAKKTSTGKSSSKKKVKVDPKACAKLGILPQSTKEGACNRGKNPIILVNGTSTLKLKELDVKVKKVSTASTVPGPAGPVKPPKKGMTFVLVELTWKNKDKKTQQLNSTQKQIKLNSQGGGGPVNQKAERAYSQSLYNAKPVKPGKKGKGTAVFMVKSSAKNAVTQRGANPQLVVFEFSTAGKKKAAPDGSIRLWNV
jgi:hypothetical protein